MQATDMHTQMKFQVEVHHSTVDKLLSKFSTSGEPVEAPVIIEMLAQRLIFAAGDRLVMSV